MAKDVLLVISFIDFPKEGGNSRFLKIIDMLNSNLYDVEIVFSSFCHTNKKQRTMVTYDEAKTCTMLNEPGYSKNICLKRLHSHKRFSLNVKMYLEHRKKPDLIYCSIPSLDVGYECANYAKRNNIPFFIDIQDLWPEAFLLKFSIPIISDLIFCPMKKKANYVYEQADKVIAVSETYLKRGLSVNKNKQGLSVFLGTDLKKLKDNLSMIVPKLMKKDGEIWIGYIGTLGSSYDIETALLSMKIVQDKYPNAILVLLGDGPLEERFKELAKSEEISAKFLGRIEYYQAMSILRQCDIVLNPLKKGAAQSIINKVGDYAALGLPVINSLECKEYQDLLNEYNAGINVAVEDSEAMSGAILYLIDHPSERQEMGKNNHILATQRFDRNTTYSSIIELINMQLSYKK